MTDSIIKVFATNWCWDCRRARKVLDSRKIPYEWINIDHDKQAESYVMQVNHGYRSVPTIQFPDGSILVEPSNRNLEDKLESLSAQISIGGEAENA